MRTLLLLLILSLPLSAQRFPPGALVSSKAAAAAGGFSETPLISTDTFGDTQTPMTTPWVRADASGEFNEAAGVAAPEFLTGDATYKYDGGITWATNQYAQVKISVTGTTEGTGPGLSMRNGSANNGTYYRVVVSKAAANTVTIDKFIAGSLTALTTRTTTWVDGDTLKVWVTGTTTVTIKVFQNGTQLGADITDSSSTLQAGMPGISYSSTSTLATLDDFLAGGL